MSGKPADSTNDSTDVELPEVSAESIGTDNADLQPTHHEVSEASRPSDESASQEVSLTVQSTEEDITHKFSTEPSTSSSVQTLSPSNAQTSRSSDQSYPTEARLAAQQRHKAGIKPKKKAKQVEQHFDDCGEDLTPLLTHVAMFDNESDTSSEDEVAERELSHLLNSFTTHGFYGSECDVNPETHSGTILAVDWDEAFAILTSKPYGVEIVELCGGIGLTSHMCIRRHMSAGHNFELLTGCDLTDPAVQSKVLAYLDIAKPLVVVMGPRCDPFGPLGRWNRAVHPEGWSRSYAEAAPLAEFCGRVALLQITKGRHFLCEQPQSSALFQEEPWPKVMQHHGTRRIVFHQCRVKQYVNGLLCKKATELVASSAILLQPFVGLTCQGDHVHAVLTGGQATKAQRWSKNMCDRIAYGIQQLRKSLLKELRTSQALPTVEVDASGEAPSPSDETGGSEPWRKCKGCRWRLPMNDPEHSRVVGECKHPDVESITFDCPGCKARRPRSDAAHTFGPDCRHAVTRERKKVPKRQRGRVPTTEEPTSSLRSRGLGDADEQQAERQLETPGESGRDPGETGAPGEPELESGESGDLQIVPAEEADHRTGRGPDVLQRIRRTYREGDTQTPDPSDWTSFDISASLRGLRLAPEAGQRRILRKLHLRWWHASANRMEQLLKAAGLDRKILDLIPEIVDSCRVCRTWQRPSSDNVASSRLVTGFNLEVEGDIMFIHHGGITHSVLHLVDRGVRWGFATVLPDKTTESLLSGLDQWITVFGPMQILIFDGETGLDDAAASQYFELKGITKRTSAPGQHVRICDRRTRVLRDTIHKITSQLSEEGLTVPLGRVVAEATYAGNALTSFKGVSPYTAVLGRVPPLLPDAIAITDDTDASVVAQHSHRLREIAIQAIVEASAQDRLKRASHTITKPAGEEFELKLGEEVEYYRPPLSRDASGWRGPAVICDLTRLEHGRVGIRTRSDHVLTCRLQDIRRCLTYLAEMESPLSSPGGQAQQILQEYVDNTRQGTVLILGQVYDKTAGWRMSKNTHNHNMVYQAAVVVAECVFHLQNLAAVRLGVGVRTLPRKEEYTASTTIFWTAAGTKSLEFLTSEDTHISFVDMLGQSWTSVKFVQFLMVNAEDDFQNELQDTLTETTEEAASDRATGPSSHGGISVGGPLSTIPEGSNEASAEVSWQEVEEAFGILPDDPRASELQAAFSAITSESSSKVPVFEMSKLINGATGAAGLEALNHVDIPEWKDVSFVTEDERLMSQCVLSEAMRAGRKEPPILEDQDDYGAYVAIEVYMPVCKVLEGLERLPWEGEHVEMRFYESHTRKTIIERSDDLLTDQEMRENAQAVFQAMLDELLTWNSFRCFKRIPKGETKCVIDCKWVLKWKVKNGERKIRARLCLRGFKETGADGESNYSATATRLSQRILVSEAALRGWVLASTDVPKAFLQGVSYQELAETTGKPLRDVSFTLSRQGNEVLKMVDGFQDFDPAKEVLHCLKPGTGCRDAPRSFSIQLRKVTEAFGLKSSMLDQELELLYDSSGELQMMVIKHVDDLKMAGPKGLIEKFVEHISRAFGKLDTEFHSFTFCGVKHTQREDIVLDQIKFISAIKEMLVPEAYMKVDHPLPEPQQRQFLSLLMTVAYALLTRIDVAVYVTALQRECQKPKPIHVRRLNLLLRWMQRNPRGLRYRPMPKYPDALVQYSDSGFKARSEDGLSVRGMISLRMNSEDLKNPSDAPCHLLEYVSKSQRHVTRSTFSSELFAATDAIDAGLLTRLVLHELKYGPLTDLLAKQLIEGSATTDIQLHAVLDAKSVTSAITAPFLKVPAEPSLLVHVRWVRALLLRKVLTGLWWSDTRAMLADGLTKGSVDRSALETVANGWHEIRHALTNEGQRLITINCRPEGTTLEL